MELSVTIKQLAASARRDSQVVAHALRREAVERASRLAGRFAGRTDDMGYRLADAAETVGAGLIERTGQGNTKANKIIQHTVARVEHTAIHWSRELGDKAVQLGEQLTERRR
jgi:hypothetical protein